MSRSLECAAAASALIVIALIPPPTADARPQYARVFHELYPDTSKTMAELYPDLSESLSRRDYHWTSNCAVCHARKSAPPDDPSRDAIQAYYNALKTALSARNVKDREQIRKALEDVGHLRPDRRFHPLDQRFKAGIAGR